VSHFEAAACAAIGYRLSAIGYRLSANHKREAAQSIATFRRIGIAASIGLLIYREDLDEVCV
jgi:hypothetical protein